MSNVPHPVANILIGDDWEDVVTLEQMHAYAAAVSAAKDAEIAGLRAVIEKLVDWNKAYPSSRVFSHGQIVRIAAEMESIYIAARAALGDKT